jgi:hypothetical protein
MIDPNASGADDANVLKTLSVGLCVEKDPASVDIRETVIQPRRLRISIRTLGRVNACLRRITRSCRTACR